MNGRRQCTSDVSDSSCTSSSNDSFLREQSPLPSLPDQVSTDIGEQSEEDLFTLLDRVAAKKDQFWDDVQPDVQELQSYHDAHPSVIVDQDRHIEVFIGGDSQDYRGLLRVSTEEYFARVNNRERRLCLYVGA